MTRRLATLLLSLSLPALAGGPVGVAPLTPARATALLFDGLPDGGAAPDCWGATDGGPIPCLLAARYAQDPAAAKVARALWENSGDVAGVLPEEDFEGGYRGVIHLVPQLAVGPERHHLEWVAQALADYDAFFAGLEATAGRAPHYRWQGLGLRFFRSVGKRTPAAFAQGWTVSYNVHGTLNGSARAVRDLLFHELFHLNDADHGDWTSRALAWPHATIRARCGARTACLEPYAPDPLIVYGGTYYSFQPGNDEREYGADLALRYWREQREVLAGHVVKRPFKCGPPENGRAWRALVDEFFAGVDRVPPCPGAAKMMRGGEVGARHRPPSTSSLSVTVYEVTTPASAPASAAAPGTSTAFTAGVVAPLQRAPNTRVMVA